jgi:hypothetical protein
MYADIIAINREIIDTRLFNEDRSVASALRYTQST